MSNDAALGVPLLVLHDKYLTAIEQRIYLMPCSATEELIALQAREGPEMLLEVSGLITAWRGMNWLLPAAANVAGPASSAPVEPTPIPPGGRAKPIVVVEAETNTESSAPPEVATSESAIIATTPETIADELDSLLDRAVPVVPRSGDAGAATVAPADPRATEHGVLASSASPSPTILLARPIRVQDRRATFVRDERSGALRAVFTGKSGGVPSNAEVLPCTLLDSIETATRRSAAGTSLLVSGIVTQGSGGRSYFLPTKVRALREGKWISP